MKFKLNVFQIETLIGEGTYAKVFKVRCRLEKEKVYALKEIDSKYFSEEGISGFVIREISTLGKLNHPNILPLLDFFQRLNKTFLLFPLCKTSLREFMHKSYLKKLALWKVLKKNDSKDVLNLTFKSTNLQAELDLVAKWTLQLTSALNYLKNRKIIHRDLKPENILLDEKNNLQIIDFGMSKSSVFESDNHSPNVVNLPYKAPELFRKSVFYGHTIDWWSAGCIIIECIIGKRLFPGKNATKTKNAVRAFQEKGSLMKEKLKHLLNTVLGENTCCEILRMFKRRDEALEGIDFCDSLAPM